MWRTWRFQYASKRQLRRSLSEGRITQAQHDKCVEWLSFRNAERVLQEAQLKSGKYPVLEAIWKFVSDNWEEILSIILKLAPLVLDDCE